MIRREHIQANNNSKNTTESDMIDTLHGSEVVGSKVDP